MLFSSEFWWSVWSAYHNIESLLGDNDAIPEGGDAKGWRCGVLFVLVASFLHHKVVRRDTVVHLALAAVEWLPSVPVDLSLQISDLLFELHLVLLIINILVRLAIRSDLTS